MIELYPFQARGLDEGRAYFRAGARSVVFVGPTGMGKTTLASAAARGAVARGTKVAAFAHRRELVVQMSDRFRSFGLDVGALGLRPAAPVQVTSVQACLSRGELPDAGLVILDEAHHYVSDEWIRVPRAYAERGARIMGLTATPERDDGRGLGGDAGIFDALVVVAQVRELVELNAHEEDKGLTPIDLVVPDGDVRALAQAPVDAYLEHVPGRSCVVFAPNVKSAHAFRDDFRARGVDADVVHGELDTASRDGALARFARGELRVLVNVAVLTEGWDAPICDVCMLARKVGSLSLYLQMVGRARRARRGKRNAVLVDLSGNIEIHGHPDAELVYSLEGAGVARADGARMIRPRFCRACKRELPRDGDLGACFHPGACVEGDHCPECGMKISKLAVPTPEEIALIRLERDEARAKTPPDKRTKALVSLYAKGLRNGAKKSAAEQAYRSMFRHYPPTDVRAPAWREAVGIVAAERGDAWTPPA